VTREEMVRYAARHSASFCSPPSERDLPTPAEAHQ
jgi:hypothetical protein